VPAVYHQDHPGHALGHGGQDLRRMIAQLFRGGTLIIDRQCSVHHRQHGLWVSQQRVLGSPLTAVVSLDSHIVTYVHVKDFIAGLHNPFLVYCGSNANSLQSRCNYTCTPNPTRIL
jgi:hypothetical protein